MHYYIFEIIKLCPSSNLRNHVLNFINTKSKAHEVSKRLEYNGYKCKYIMGDLQQSKRLKIIESIKSGKLKYLVATDVAARGLHVDDLETLHETQSDHVLFRALHYSDQSRTPGYRIHPKRHNRMAQ